MKSLDHKLARIRAGAYTPTDFVIADAKDGEMGFGISGPGPSRDPAARHPLKSKAEYLDAMREMTESGLVDIMLTSASACETLAKEGLFGASPVTPAVRLNDTTDIWNMRGSLYTSEKSRPWRSARIDRVRPFADLGLYSVTFSNDVDRDLASLAAYAAFRDEAAPHGMRHFLEVFNPAMDVGIPQAEIGTYVNDCIVRSLAGVVSVDRPLFLKIVYNGAAAMEELASFDPSGIVVGILGGARGTTRDTFELIGQAAAHGARVALFGRRINYAESPLDLVRLMRAVVEHQVTPKEAVRAYHAALSSQSLRPDRDIDVDIAVTDPVLTAEAAP